MEQLWDYVVAFNAWLQPVRDQGITWTISYTSFAFALFGSCYYAWQLRPQLQNIHGLPGAEIVTQSPRVWGLEHGSISVRRLMKWALGGLMAAAACIATAELFLEPNLRAVCEWFTLPLYLAVFVMCVVGIRVIFIMQEQLREREKLSPEWEDFFRCWAMQFLYIAFATGMGLMVCAMWSVGL